MEGRWPLADSAPSEGSGKQPAKTEQAATSAPKVDGATFANTKQHVADRQAGGGGTELFTNTKLNIALINDPKNGPRFTMTKRESGLDEDGDRGQASDKAEKPADETLAKAPPATPEAKSPSAVDAPATSPPEREAAQITAGQITAGETSAGEPEVPDIPNAAPAAVEPASAASVVAAAAMARATTTGLPPAAEPPSKIPVDSSKTFVGHNGTYYDESWRWMDWRGTRRSWNWPAALSFGHWFAYRRLYLYAGLYLLWLAGLAAATVNNVPVLALVVLALLVVGLAGVYGNTLYFLAFRRAVDHVTENGEGSYQELRGQLAAAGGTSIWALGVMGLLSIAGIAGALAATHYVSGGFTFNLWPFF